MTIPIWTRRGLVLLALGGSSLIGCGRAPADGSTSPLGERASATEREAPADTPAESSQPPTEDALAAGLGSVSGRVIYWKASGFVPDDAATVYVVGREDLLDQTDSEGRYALPEVPEGLQLVIATSAIGNGYRQVTVLSGEALEIDLSTFAGFPSILFAPSGGIVQLDGEPVAGAKVWTVGRALPILLVSDDQGYFSFQGYLGFVIAVLDDRYAVAELAPREVITIELDQTGVNAAVPEVPVTASIPRSEVLGTPPILPTRPVLIVTLLPPVLRLEEDCLSYRPENLRIVDEGGARVAVDGWRFPYVASGQ